MRKIFLGLCLSLLMGFSAVTATIVLDVPEPAEIRDRDGIAFSVFAERDLVVTGFRLRLDTGTNQANRTLRIYTRAGTFNDGMLSSSAGWTQVDQREPGANQFFNNVNFNLDAPVAILGGTTQSFFIGFRRDEGGNVWVGRDPLTEALSDGFLTLLPIARSWDVDTGYFDTDVNGNDRSFFGRIAFELTGGGGPTTGQASQARAAAVAAKAAQQQLQRQQQRRH